MLFGQSFLDLLQPETARLLNRADRMTDACAEKIARTNAWIKATDYAYANQDWMGYLATMTFTMWSMQCCDGKYLKRMLQYSNDFIRFGKEQFKQTLAGAGRNAEWACRNYVNGFSYIYDFYVDYYQISDEKINELLDLYVHEFRAYPASSTEYHFMSTKMLRSMDLRDKKQTETCLRRVQALQRQTKTCYVCNNREITGALLFLGRTDEALHLIQQIISDEGIPEWWYEDYSNCENANAYEQYSALIRNAFWLNMPDLMRRFAQDFQTEILAGSEDEVGWDMDFTVLTIIRGADVRRVHYLAELSNTLDTLQERTPLDQLHFLLSSWGYLEMLHQSGVETVPLTLLKPPIDGRDDQYDTHAFAEYCLKKADMLGAKFDRARPSFQYEVLRKTALAMLDPA